MQNDKTLDFINNHPKTFLISIFAFVLLCWALVWIAYFSFQELRFSAKMRQNSNDFATIIEEAYDL